MVSINEIDSVRNMDELKFSNSKTVRSLPDLEVLDSEIAGAHKKLLTADFKRRVYLEEQKALQHNRFLKGCQICLLDL